MNTGTGRESDKFMLRLPNGMRDRIKLAADAKNRSMNAEIVARLEQSLAFSEEWDNLLSNIDDAHSRIESLERQMQDVLYRIGAQDYPGN